VGLQAALGVLYPPQCVTCDARVTEAFGLCPDCWSATPFLTGAVCDGCGAEVLGTQDDDGPHRCDDCHAAPPPWSRGRAALRYDANARHIVLALKHGDRLDLARPAAGWIHRAVAPILEDGMVVAPVPLHWFRLIRRRYNQAALLSAGLARLAGLPHVPDLLRRVRATPMQDHRGRAERKANLDGALVVHPGRAHRIDGAHLLLVDDVLTTGATLAAATEACLSAGAAKVSVAVLARVAAAPDGLAPRLPRT
jgi:ComF family protein